MAKLIVQQRPTIQLIPIEANYNTEATDQRAGYEADQYGKYPLICYRGMTVETGNIKKLKLYNDKFVPYLELEFEDPTGRWFDDYFPLDDAIISFFSRSPSKKLMPIRMDFKIVKFSVEKRQDQEKFIFSVGAELNVDGLYYRNYESYDGTSFTILKQMATELELGFASNINDTVDQMKWLNPYLPKRDFIRHITEHSYKSDETFMWSYIDFYYNLNYVDIETQLQEDISKQGTVDPYSNIIKDGKEAISKLVLTNNPDNNQGSNNDYIKYFVLENNTTQLNIDMGYKHRVHYYDHQTTNYNSTYLDSISDVGDSANIVLKGNPERPDSKFSTSLFGQTYRGKMDENNVHDNYLYAQQQNLNNLQFIQKIKMKIVLSQPNYNLYRFQKVDVILYKTNQIVQGDEEETQNIEEHNPPRPDEKKWKINNRLSGEWLITGINYTFTSGEESWKSNQQQKSQGQSGTIQEITMVKRELGTKYLKK